MCMGPEPLGSRLLLVSPSETVSSLDWFPLGHDPLPTGWAGLELLVESRLDPAFQASDGSHWLRACSKELMASL